MDVCITDFGPVVLSKKTLAYLERLSPEWRSVFSGERPSIRSKSKRYSIDQVYRAICTAAAIEFAAGKRLETF